MTERIYTYNEALEKIKPNLKVLIKKRKLREFYRLYRDKYNLSYHTLQQIASDTNKKEFPDTLFALMKIFGYKTERTKAFRIYEDDNLDNNSDTNFSVE
jgi:hypothetical protein